MGQALAGVLPVIQTPFDDADRVDHAVLAHEVSWALEQGVNGFVVAMVSEYLRLTEEERIAVSRTTVETATGLPVVVSVGAESSAIATLLTQRAESIGAAAVMAVPPFAARAHDDELVRYYEALLKATELPVIIQDASGYVGNPLTIQMQVSLLERFGERVMFKPEADPIGPRLTELRDATAGRARVLEGAGGIALVDSFRRGIVGTMPATDVCWAIVALWRALVEGDERTAYAISSALAPMIAMQSSLDAFVAIEKHLLVRQGVFTNARMRGPVGFVLDSETRDEIDRLFERLSDVVYATRDPAA
jgi:dihydrodipicolinate synthase/N-acetylneuraminate lyase